MPDTPQHVRGHRIYFGRSCYRGVAIPSRFGSVLRYHKAPVHVNDNKCKGNDIALAWLGSAFLLFVGGVCGAIWIDPHIGLLCIAAFAMILVG
jgi:hypothetical protein